MVDFPRRLNYQQLLLLLSSRLVRINIALTAERDLLARQIRQRHSRVSNKHVVQGPIDIHKHRKFSCQNVLAYFTILRLIAASQIINIIIPAFVAFFFPFPPFASVAFVPLLITFSATPSTALADPRPSDPFSLVLDILACR